MPGLYRCRQEIHLRRADKPGHELVRRFVVEFHRRAHLLNLSVVHHHNFISQGHRFYLVVGDIHHGGFQLLVQTGKVQTHLHAQLGIQVGERFVEHKDPRITYDGAANGHTLALAAGKLLRFAIQKVGKLQRFGHHLDLMADLIFRHLIDLQAVAHVFGHRHMWVERIGLKHHRHAAVGGGNVVHHLVTN